jgi:glycosyltransferase involved in cell wall biosynthesis
MRVSIIIPCFRQGRYLAEAIESCLNQTYRSVEVVVVNDGSDDNTDEVARGFHNAIKYIRKENGGVSTARNAGIAVANGAYMKFLDADDHLHPEQVARQMDALGGRADRVSLTGLRAYQEDNPNNNWDILPTFRSLVPDMLAPHDGAPHFALYPTELVRAVGGYDARWINTQDWTFNVEIGKLRPSLHCDPWIGGYYRLHQGSLSTFRRLFVEETAKQLIAYHDEFRDGPNKDWYGEHLLAGEQAIYRTLLVREMQQPELEKELLIRIRELWQAIGPPPGVSRKFLALRRALGHRMAERIYARYARYRLRRAGRL